MKMKSRLNSHILGQKENRNERSPGIPPHPLSLSRENGYGLNRLGHPNLVLLLLHSVFMWSKLGMILASLRVVMRVHQII